MSQRAEFNPWNSLGFHADFVMADQKAYLEKLLLRQKYSRDNCECWFDVDSVSSSIGDESSLRIDIRISNDVDVGLRDS